MYSPPPAPTSSLPLCCSPRAHRSEMGSARMKPVEDGQRGSAHFVLQGIAVRLPLVGEMGEPGDCTVADQAAQPVW